MAERWLGIWCVIVALTSAGCVEEAPVAPVAVSASPDTPDHRGVVEDTGELTQARRAQDDAQRPAERADASERARAPEDAPELPPRPGADGVASGAVWVIDSAGQEVGALVRRGSDDNLVYRAIYDLVTVYHPSSGLFFEITMTDAVVRRPSKTFFATPTCDGPVGISYGGCNECRSGPSTALLHEESWYQVTPGVTFEMATAGSSLGTGIEDACSSHHTDSAKIFPLTQVSGPTPPTNFTPPLHFAWR